MERALAVRPMRRARRRRPNKIHCRSADRQDTHFDAKYVITKTICRTVRAFLVGGHVRNIGGRRMLNVDGLNS